MRQVTKHILLVVALSTLTLIPLWIFIIAPRLTQLSSHFSYTADLVSLDNLYDASVGDFSGASQSDTQFSYHVVDVQPGVTTIKNTFDLRTAGGEPILHIERLYGVSPTTYRHVIGFGDHDRVGYLFAPSNLSVGEDFTYWHVNYDVPAEMHYIGQQNIDGLNTFHYHTTLTADQTELLNQLPHVGETLGVNVDVDLDVWIEPTTGWLVKYADSAVGYYYDLGSSERLRPWNAFSNTYTEESVSKQAAYAQKARILFLCIHAGVPWICFIFFVLCLIPLVMNRFVWFDRLVRTLMPFVVTLAGVGLSVFGCIVSIRLLSIQDASAFEADANKAVDQITDRSHVYRDILDGVQSLFVSSEEVTREEFHTYVAGLDIQSRYPGIQGVGYAMRVSSEDKTAHESQMRAEGFEQYHIFPEGDRALYTPVMYIEPFDAPNQRAFGYDMSSEDVRRTAMEQARDSGAPIVSGSVILAQDTGLNTESGFLLYVPYYGHDPVYTVADRRGALQGFVFAPLRVDDLIDGIFEGTVPKVAFNIYDAEDDSEMYTSQDMDVLGAGEQGLNTVTRHVFLFGHRWKIVLAELPSARYNTTIERMVPVLILGSGVGMSFLIGCLLYLAERGYLSVEPKRRPRGA